MRYMGGKSRIAKRLAAFMQPFVDDVGAYVEPFVGSAAVLSMIKAPIRIASDANQALITMWQAVCDGWEPPSTLTEAEYKELKTKKDPLDPKTAFAGFGCSFGGDWFHGFAKNKGGYDYPRQTRNSLLKIKPKLEGVIFNSVDYKNVVFDRQSVIYCDPPYAKHSTYGACAPFDHTQFWDWCRNKKSAGHIVFVSEYSAPPDFNEVFSILKRTGLRLKDQSQPIRTEKLFTPR